MNDSPDDSSFLDRIRSWARTKAHASKFNPFGGPGQGPILPLTDNPRHPTERNDAGTSPGSAAAGHGEGTEHTHTSRNDFGDAPTTLPPPAPAENTEQPGEASAAIEPDEQKPNVVIRFYQVSKDILLSSWLNVLLVFVPIGIAVEIIPGVSPNIVFAMNAIAVIPLAGLLAYATESVASKMGDTVGALMNVTFGNAVELIIFIALVKNEIRIVQASLLGSILANLLLILGMCFLFGGLRFREQIYNSTVTQMSACLLSLSVMSLLLPTAFHASFANAGSADLAVLKLSRGTSVVLLVVYVLYLLFQLKSHAYMYESTPQHIIDEESHPGFLADMLGSSSSSDSSDSSSGSDSDRSSVSHSTAKRIKRALRGRRRRKSSASSQTHHSIPSTVQSATTRTGHNVFESSDFAVSDPSTEARSPGHELGPIASGDEADTEHDDYMRSRPTTINFRDFENEKAGSLHSPESRSNKAKKSKKKKHKKKCAHCAGHGQDLSEKGLSKKEGKKSSTESERRLQIQTLETGVVDNADVGEEGASRRPFRLSVRPALPKMLSGTVFSSTGQSNPAAAGPSAPMTPYGLRRTSSLPDRLNKTQTVRVPSAQPLPYIMPVNASHISVDSKENPKAKKYMSRTSAILLLLVSTALVAVCAEFLVDSINGLVKSSTISEAFIGLIILPIVGNAAEHVTAVTVASKNKMDLAIGVAVGSSIQIALFITPIVILLGWILEKDMSLYFTLFETVSLFVSCFIVNFLVLDGRSNYLEGSLLIAAYVIIAVGAFFYPTSVNQNADSSP
ncbi:MAG: hypothetical protein M1819_000642 [Sarea resinae]|nr:MAG: hypothetical protein M1819_000642 [Sarea resinae]